MRKKLLVLVAAMMLFTLCKENKSEGDAASSESISSAATSVDAFEEKETTMEFTYTILNDTETVLTERQSVTVTSEITETSAEAPINLVPVLTAKNIDSETNSLSWTAVEGTESYILYLLNNETGEFEEYGEIKETSCKDINLIPNTKYTYSVAAKFNDGILGEKSDAADIYTYNLCATAKQDDWIYSCEYNNAKAKIIRTKIDNSITEDITDYSFESVKDLCVMRILLHPLLPRSRNNHHKILGKPSCFRILRVNGKIT